MGAYPTSIQTPDPRGSTQIALGSRSNHWFQALPPERIGLYGEYDHHGLQKRVQRALIERFGDRALARLAVFQRGRVVILHGAVASQEQLRQMVQVILTLPGTAHVELRGIEYVPKIGRAHV